MTQWDIERTRRQIQKSFGREQLELARPCLRSLTDRQIYARMHFQRAEQTLNRYIKNHLHDKDFWKIAYAIDEPEWQRFNHVIRKVGADLTACVQSVHSLPDILASAVYFSLAIDRTQAPKPGKYVNHSFVAECLKDVPHCADVRTHLTQATAGKDFKHIAALSNQSKHYSIVFPSLNADLTGDRPEKYLVCFPAFPAGRHNYPQTAAKELLSRVYSQLSKSVVETGNAILRCLDSAA